MSFLVKEIMLFLLEPLLSMIDFSDGDFWVVYYQNKYRAGK